MLHPYFTDWTLADSSKLLRLFLDYLRQHPEEFDAKHLGELAMLEFYWQKRELTYLDYQKLATQLATNDSLREEVFNQVKPITGDYVGLLFEFLHQLPRLSLEKANYEQLVSIFSQNINAELGKTEPQLVNSMLKQKQSTLVPANNTASTEQLSDEQPDLILGQTLQIMSASHLEQSKVPTITTKQLKNIAIQNISTNTAEEQKQPTLVGGLPKEQIYSTNRFRRSSQREVVNSKQNNSVAKTRIRPSLSLGIKAMTGTVIVGSTLGVPVLMQILNTVTN